LNRANIAPVAAERIRVDAVDLYHARDNVAPEITFRTSDAGVVFQASNEDVTVEDVDAHADQVALGLGRFFVEADDAAIRRGDQRSEAMRFGTLVTAPDGDRKSTRL